MVGSMPKRTRGSSHVAILHREPATAKKRVGETGCVLPKVASTGHKKGADHGSFFTMIQDQLKVMRMTLS